MRSPRGCAVTCEARAIRSTWSRSVACRPSSPARCPEKQRGSAPAVLERLARERDRLADVMDGAAAQALGKPVVLALLDVAGRLLEQVARRLDPIAVAQPGVDRRMVAQRLAVVDRCLADLADRTIDLA